MNDLKYVEYLENHGLDFDKTKLLDTCATIKYLRNEESNIRAKIEFLEKTLQENLTEQAIAKDKLTEILFT